MPLFVSCIWWVEVSNCIRRGTPTGLQWPKTQSKETTKKKIRSIQQKNSMGGVLVKRNIDERHHKENKEEIKVVGTGIHCSHLSKVYAVEAWAQLLKRLSMPSLIPWASIPINSMMRTAIYILLAPNWTSLEERHVDPDPPAALMPILPDFIPGQS